jgi:hypothetical protein
MNSKRSVSLGLGLGLGVMVVLCTLAVPVWAQDNHGRYWASNGVFSPGNIKSREIDQNDDDKRDDDRRGDDRRDKPPAAPEQPRTAPGGVFDLRSKDIRRDDDRHDDDRRDGVRVYSTERGVFDNRYEHNRYYPPQGVVVRTLPPNYRRIPYRDIDYYFYGGVWYRPIGAEFSVVMPPIGLTVPVLPPFYTTIWFGGIPYYYANHIYYTWVPERRVYVVTEPPGETQATPAAETADELFIYPKQGQSAEQQAEDRYQCHRWAVEQTGFDPTRAGGNVEPAQYIGKRADYQRAMKACLEARGYSVQ